MSIIHTQQNQRTEGINMSVSIKFTDHVDFETKDGQFAFTIKVNDETIGIEVLRA